MAVTPPTPPSGNSNNDLLKAINALTRAVDKINDSGASSSSAANSSAARNRSMSGSTKSLDKFSDELENAQASAEKFQEMLDKASRASSVYIKTIFEADHVTNKALDNMTEELEKTSNSFSGMVGKMIEASSSMDDVKKQFDLLNLTTDIYNRILTKSSNKSLTGLKSISAMHNAIDLFATNMSDVNASSAKAGAESILEMKELALTLRTSSNEQLRLAARESLLNLKRDKTVTGNIAAFKKLEKNLVATAKGAAEFKNVIDSSTRLNNVFNGISATGEALMRKLGVAEIATLSGAFALLVSGVTRAYTSLVALSKFGQAGTIDSIESIIGGSFRLGVATEKLAAIMQDSARQVGQLGSSGFIDTLERGQLSLMQLGLSTEEAIEGVADFTKTAQISGVDIRNQQALDNSIKAQTRSFKRLSAMTGISAKQFDAMNRALIEDNNIRTTMMRMAPGQRANAVQSMIMERERLVTMGASNEQAQQLIKATAGVLQLRVKDRLEAAAKVQQAAGLVGMGAEGAQAANIIRKGSRATAEEKSILADFSGTLKGQMESMAGAGGLGTENLMDALDEGMPAAAASLLDAGLQLKQAADAQMGLTMSEKAGLIEKREISPDAAKTIKAVSQVGNILTNPLFAIGAGIGGIIWQLVRIRAALVSNGKGGLLKEGKSHVTAAKDYLSKSSSQKTPHVGGTPAGGGGLVGKLMGGAKFLGPAALALTAAYGAINGWMNAAETFGVETATTGQKVSAALGGAIDTLTFGLLDGAEMSKAIYSAANFVSDKVSIAWDWIKDMFMGYLKTMAGFYGKMGKTIAKFLGFESTVFDDLLAFSTKEEKKMVKVEKSEKDVKVSAEKAGTAATKASESISNANILQKTSMDAVTASSLINEGLAGKVTSSAAINTLATKTADKTATTNKINTAAATESNIGTGSSDSGNGSNVLSEILTKITELVEIEKNAAMESQTHRRISSFGRKDQLDKATFISNS